MKHPHKSRAGSGVILTFSAILLLALMSLPGCNGDDRPGRVEHVITITPDGSHCKLAGDGGGATVTVDVGDWVIWKNEYGSDVSLIFGDAKRLFGVYKAVVYANSDLELRVRNDADSDINGHSYNVPCAATHPGPKIIVNPPS